MQIAGDGQASLDGKPLGQKLQFDGFQKNVLGAEVLDPATNGKPRLLAMSWGTTALDPLLPDAFANANPWRDLGDKLTGGAVSKAGAAIDAVEDKVEGVADAAVKRSKSAVKTLTSTLKDLFER